MTRTRRIVIGGSAALGVVAAVALALRPRPVEVETAAVVRGALQVTVDEERDASLSAAAALVQSGAGPVAVLGDLNATPYSPRFATFLPSPA